MNSLSLWFSRLKGTPVASITARELSSLLQNGKRPFILDVRQPEEFHLAHIADARLVPLGQLDAHLQALPTDREIICICASGHRSVPAVRKLLASGRTARSLKNGMLAWQIAGLPVKRGS